MICRVTRSRSKISILSDQLDQTPSSTNMAPQRLVLALSLCGSLQSRPAVFELIRANDKCVEIWATW